MEDILYELKDLRQDIESGIETEIVNVSFRIIKIESMVSNLKM